MVVFPHFEQNVSFAQRQIYQQKRTARQLIGEPKLFINTRLLVVSFAAH